MSCAPPITICTQPDNCTVCKSILSIGMTPHFSMGHPLDGYHGDGFSFLTIFICFRHAIDQLVILGSILRIDLSSQWGTLAIKRESLGFAHMLVSEAPPWLGSSFFQCRLIFQTQRCPSGYSANCFRWESFVI